MRYDTPEEVKAYLDAFYEQGGRQIDTARNYSPHAPGSCEARLGTIQVGNRFSVDTKVVSFTPGSHTRAKILESVDTSLNLLKMSTVNVEYLHVPDRTTPFEETVKAMDEAYKAGKFQHFGLSNFTAEEVEKVLKICEEKGFVKPSVYQGQYNPVVRSGEKELFPLLRKHRIAFYAWRSALSSFTSVFTLTCVISPAAAGIFAGNHKHIKPGDRFDSSVSLSRQYQAPSLTLNYSTAWAKHTQAAT